jgi:hypothetical protein
MPADEMGCSSISLRAASHVSETDSRIRYAGMDRTEMHVEAQKVDQFARGIDFRLIKVLALA